MLFDNAIQTQAFRFSDFISAPNGALYGETSINRVFINSFASNSVNKIKFKIYGTGAIDNLRLTSITAPPPISVPEPGSLALFGLTLLGMMGFNRRLNYKRLKKVQ